MAAGEARGRLENQVETAEGLLRVGVAWEVSEAAAGLTEVGFRTLEGLLEGSGSQEFRESRGIAANDDLAMSVFAGISGDARPSRTSRDQLGEDLRSLRMRTARLPAPNRSL